MVTSAIGWAIGWPDRPSLCRTSPPRIAAYRATVLLDGVRVLDLTQYLSGPSCTRLLAALGADVIKVEFGPGGDPSRTLPVIRDDRSAYYVQQNRGKRSVAVDFSHPASASLIAELADRSDVLVENFGPGVLERRDLGHETLQARNPRLIFASISGFGRTGSRSHLPGYDLIGQAFSGMMHLTGEPDGPPQSTGSPIADFAAGLSCFGAIGHALFARERTGRGERIDVSLVEPLVYMHSIAVMAPSASEGAYRQTRTGRHFGAVAPSGTFRGPDGWLVLQVLDPQWPRLCAAMGRPELATDPRWADTAGRAAHADEINTMVENWMGSFPSNAALLAHLEAHRLPAAPVIDPADTGEDPWFRERGIVCDVDDEVLGRISVTGLPMRFGTVAPPTVDRPAPFLGQHNAEVLAELLGYDAARIDELVADGVLMAAHR
jgi:crotonobetainyl-CoA:carnitine CoA-transferase CaiB-like acyl-CoA transferase